MTNDELDAWRWAKAIGGDTYETSPIDAYRKLVREGIEPPAAVDQDTLDTRAVLDGWEGRSLDADWLTEGAGFIAAKQALSKIKDRVRREEREADNANR